jgi:hypothetical protein
MFVHSSYPSTDLIQEGGTGHIVKITVLSDAVQPRHQNADEGKACKHFLLQSRSNNPDSGSLWSAMNTANLH